MNSKLSGLACLAAALAGGALAAPVASQASLAVPRIDAVARCAWNQPGHNPFMGELVPAIDRYTDIPAPVRARLKERMAARSYDDLVEIRRDSIRGKDEYRPEIRDMHFGTGRVCREVTRAAWSDAMRERGLVYCESGHCILVPTVCRNVSRIEKKRGPGAVAAAPSASSAGELAFDPPDAGLEADTGPWGVTEDDPIGEPHDDLAVLPAAGALVSVFDGRNPQSGRSEGFFSSPGPGREARLPREGSSGPPDPGLPPFLVPEPAPAMQLLWGVGALAWLARRRARSCSARSLACTNALDAGRASQGSGAAPLSATPAQGARVAPAANVTPLALSPSAPREQGGEKGAGMT
jgi:hypothetical protein